MPVIAVTASLKRRQLASVRSPLNFASLSHGNSPLLRPVWLWILSRSSSSVIASTRIDFAC
jgi:hypothetical protein